MLDAADLSRLDELVTPVTNKVSGAKDPTSHYVGLEHMKMESPFLLGASPATHSTSTNSVFEAGDILFGKLRPNLRKSVQAPFSGYCSTDILVLRARSGTDSRFAAKLFHSEGVVSAAIKTAIGTRMPRTSWHSLAGVEVFCPTLPEQRQIAAILDTVDAAIRGTEQVIAKLEQVKKGLLHDLLTRGLDENGELRDPERHPEQFKESVAGRIPRGWEVGSLSAYLLEPPQNGLYKPAKFYSDRGTAIVRIDGFHEGLFKPLESFRRLQLTEAEIRLYSLNPGDIVVNRVNSIDYVGKSALHCCPR